MDAKETRIVEIMNELACDYDVAEQMFIDEICDKYQTDDIDVAETMFWADAEEENTKTHIQGENT